MKVYTLKILHTMRPTWWHCENVTISSVQLLGCVRLFAILWTAARQASLSITNSQSLLKLMSIEWVMPSNNLIFCHPLLLLPSIFPNIRFFSNESALRIRWPKYWRFSLHIRKTAQLKYKVFLKYRYSLNFITYISGYFVNIHVF